MTGERRGVGRPFRRPSLRGSAQKISLLVAAGLLLVAQGVALACRDYGLHRLANRKIGLGQPLPVRGPQAQILDVGPDSGCGLLVVFDPGCGGCRQLARLTGTREMIDGLPIYWGSVGDRESTRRFIADFNLRHHRVVVLLGRGGNAPSRLSALGLHGTPTQVFFDEARSIRHILLSSELPTSEVWEPF